MAERILRYTVGNEHNPGDPWGRSELVIAADGSARLDHHFSRVPGVGAWTGRVDAAALGRLWTALEVSGFPAAPPGPFTAGATLRVLTVEVDGVPARAVLDWHRTTTLPGYADVFDLLDGVIRQLSGDTVRYPTTQPTVVSEIATIRV